MTMERRDFLHTFVGGMVGVAAVRTWPFRVYSFPSEIIIPDYTITRDWYAEVCELQRQVNEILANPFIFKRHQDHEFLYEIRNNRQGPPIYASIIRGD